MSVIGPITTYGSFHFGKSTSYAIYPQEVTTSEITENEFYKLSKDVFDVFPQDEEQKILMQLDWMNPYMSAWANKSGDIFSINFWGGFARLPFMTKTAWEFIVCHEIGHIRGGIPKQTIKDFEWASSEGQADHFAVSECLPFYYRKTSALKNRHINSFPIEIDKCFGLNLSQEDEKICLAILEGGRVFSEVLKYLNFTKTKLSYETPASKSDKLIRNSYPIPQCRLDIFFEAVNCLDKQQCDRASCWYMESN